MPRRELDTITVVEHDSVRVRNPVGAGDDVGDSPTPPSADGRDLEGHRLRRSTASSFGARLSIPTRPGDPLVSSVGASLALFASGLLLGCRTDRLPAALLMVPVIVTMAIAARRRPLRALEPLLDYRVVVVLGIGQAAGWLALIVVKYYSVSYNTMDTGSFAHVVANVAAGRGFYNNVLGEPAWADHFAPILAAIAPLFRLWPSFLWLPLLRLCAFVACLPVLWNLSGHYLERRSLRILVLLMWLTNYPLAKVMGFEFQPSTLAMPFILLAFSSWLSGRRWLSLVCLVAVLGFKEHLALVWVSFGIWLAVDRREPRKGVLISACGILLGLLIVFVVTPALAHGHANHHLGNFDPLTLMGVKLRFVILLIAYVGFIPLADPRTLLYLLPACALSLMSNHQNMVTFNFHYQDLPGTVVFVAVVVGLAKLSQRRSWLFSVPARLRVLLITTALLTLVLSSAYFPARQIRQEWPSHHDLDVVGEMSAARAALDPARTVIALDALGPYLVDFPHLRTLDSPDSAFVAEGQRYVVVAENVNPWPLGSHLEEVEARLNHMVAEGTARRLGTTTAVMVYEIPSKDP